MYVRSSYCGVTRIGAMEKILTYFETATPSAIFHYCSVYVLFTVKQCSSTTFGIQSKINTRSLPIRTLAPTSMNFIPAKRRWSRCDLRPNVCKHPQPAPLHICCPAGFGEGHHFAFWSIGEGQDVDFFGPNRNHEGFLVTDHCLRHQCECEEWMSGWKKNTLCFNRYNIQNIQTYL